MSGKRYRSHRRTMVRVCPIPSPRWPHRPFIRTKASTKRQNAIPTVSMPSPLDARHPLSDRSLPRASNARTGGHWLSNNYTTPTATSNAYTPLGDVVAYGAIDDRRWRPHERPRFWAGGFGHHTVVGVPTALTGSALRPVTSGSTFTIDSTRLARQTESQNQPYDNDVILISYVLSMCLPWSVLLLFTLLR